MSLLAAPGSIPEQQETEPVPSQKTITTRSEAVVVDFVARDRNGRPVPGLTADQVRVFEDGVEQEIISFASHSDVLASRKEPSDDPAKPRAADPLLNGDPFRYLNLISLVFDRQSVDGRYFSKQGADDFLKDGVDENTLVGVFVIEHRLHVLQQFTQDTQLIKSAVKEATSGEYARFADESEQIKQTLEQARASRSSASAAAGSLGRGSRPSAGMAASFAQAQLAEMTLSMLQRSEELAREQQGIASIYGLLALVGEQRRLAGRKTVLYFSEGIHAPPNLLDRFRYTISAANKANVSVYSIDTRGLKSSGQMDLASEMLRQTAEISQNQQEFGVGRAVTREEVMIPESAEASLRLNVQGTLADLAEGTGGFLIANTNDLRPSLQRLKEDLQVYYELAYMPHNKDYNGQFREVRIEVEVPDVVVQGRKGYFAMPPAVGGPPVFPYEVPLLAALNSNPLPSDLEFRARMLTFGSAGRELQHSAAVDVPLSGITVREDKENGVYNARFSLMVLVKDLGGTIVEKLSQDFPLQGPVDRIEAIRDSHLLFLRQFNLISGSYRVEYAVYEQETNKRAARRSLLVVPELSDGVRMSSLSVIDRIDPVRPEEDVTENPYVVEQGKIVPDLRAVISKESGRNPSIYLAAWPSVKSKEKPTLELLALLNGKVTGASTLPLPEPGPDGRITYIATLPVSALPAGYYEIRATVRQGEDQATESCFFTLEP